ncbi:hypothetical protein MicB006_6255 [Micromonospora sp. B006]|nr:hypothetical protein MicB006_6255 [Micromonospora sp. B006]
MDVQVRHVRREATGGCGAERRHAASCHVRSPARPSPRVRVT